MKKDPQQIEELLQQSTRAPQSLSSSEKDALWTRIQNMAEQQCAVGVTEQVLESDEYNGAYKWWAQPLKLQWSVSLGMAAVMLAVAGVYSTLDATQHAQEQAQVAALQTADYSQRETIEEVLPDNPEEEINETQLATEQPATLFSTDLRNLIGGFGGGLNLHTNLWKVEAVIELSNEKPVSKADLHLFRLPEEHMQSIANIFPVVETTRYHDGKQPHHRIPFVTNLSEGIANGGGCFDNALRNTMGTQACVAVSELGAVEFVQEEAVADADGFIEAYSYIEILTGYSQDEITVVDLGVAEDFREDAEFFVGAHEYLLYPKNSSENGLYYQDLGWHMVLSASGKLLFLNGSVPEIHISENSTTYNLISEAEAVERLRVDWSSPISMDISDIPPTPNYVHSQKFGRSYVHVPGYIDENGSYVTVEDEDVHVTIESARLEYRIFTQSVYKENKETLSAIAMPVWILRGREQSSGLPYEGMVEATEEHLFDAEGIGRRATHPSHLQ